MLDILRAYMINGLRDKVEALALRIEQLRTYRESDYERLTTQMHDLRRDHDEKLSDTRRDIEGDLSRLQDKLDLHRRAVVGLVGVLCVVIIALASRGIIGTEIVPFIGG